MPFVEIDPDGIEGNVIKRIRDQWMLIGAGTEGKANSMIGSWGFMGEMWRKDVAVCVVRPQRYTYEFMESNDTYALSFLPDKYNDVKRIYGSQSGRDINKLEGGALTPAYAQGALYYEEAELVLFCRKIYVHDYEGEGFIDTSLVESCYGKGDFHRVYYGEILQVLKREE
ncbi:MAG: flavin reductase [Spirochaetales bacterium]|nr:flavin reductase [Spirochaetales bacterium]